MARPYDYDLRKRAIFLINSGKKRVEVSELLQISIPTIDRWIARYKETKDVRLRQEVKAGRKVRIQDQNKFLEFIEENKHLSLEEMQFKLKTVSAMTIYRNLKRLGYSYKKSSGYIRKEMKNKEGDIFWK